MLHCSNMSNIGVQAVDVNKNVALQQNNFLKRTQVGKIQVW